MAKITLYLQLLILLIGLPAAGQTSIEHRKIDLERKNFIEDFKLIKDSAYVGLVSNTDWSNGYLSRLDLVFFNKNLKRIKRVELDHQLIKKKITILDVKIIRSNLLILYQFNSDTSITNNISFAQYKLVTGEKILNKLLISSKSKVTDQNNYIKGCNQNYTRGSISENGKYVVVEYPIFSRGIKQANNDLGSIQINSNFRVVNLLNRDSLIFETESIGVNLNEFRHVEKCTIDTFGISHFLLKNRSDDSKLKYLSISENLHQVYDIDLGSYVYCKLIKSRSPKLLVLREEGTYKLFEYELNYFKRKNIFNLNHSIKKKLTLDGKNIDSHTSSFEIIPYNKGYILKTVDYFENIEKVNHPTKSSSKTMNYMGEGTLYYCDAKKNKIKIKSFLNSNKDPFLFYITPSIELSGYAFQFSQIQAGQIYNENFKDDFKSKLGYENKSGLDYIITNLNKPSRQTIIRTDVSVDFSDIESNSFIKVDEKTVLFRTICYKNTNSMDRDNRIFPRYELFRFQF